MTRRQVITVALFAVIAIIATAAPLRAQEVNPSVESGRKALVNSVPDPPWYDASTDGVGRFDVKLKKPKPKTESDYNPRMSTPDAGAGMSGLVMLAWVVMAVVVVGLAFLLTQAFLKSENKHAVAAAQSQPETAARVEELPVRVPRGTSDLLGEARRQRDAGNYSEAIIYLYSYQLLELDRHQLIRLARGKTNRQYVGELSEHVALRGLLDQTMVNFEHVFFGNRPLSSADFEACWLRLDEFHSLTQQVPA